MEKQTNANSLFHFRTLYSVPSQYREEALSLNLEVCPLPLPHGLLGGEGGETYVAVPRNPTDLIHEELLRWRIESTLRSGQCCSN